MADSLLADLLALMPDTVVVEAYQSADGYGTPVLGAPASIRARVTGRHVLVRDAQGQERVSRIQAWLASGTAALRDRYTLPERFGATLAERQPQAIAVEHQSDENGGHHQKVFF